MVHSLLNGLNVTSDNSLWNRHRQRSQSAVAPSYDNVAWESPEIGAASDAFVATDVRNGQDCVFSSAQHAVVGLAVVPPPTPTPTPNPRIPPRPRPTPLPR